MTDRIKGLTVCIEEMREDDAQRIIEAIQMLRGVVSVTTHVADLHHHLAVTAAKREIQEKIFEAIS